MKKFVLVVGIVLMVLGVLISCAPEPAVVFDNFMNDLDIEGRFSDYAAEIERGKSSDIILKGIDVIIEDLNTMTLDSAKAKEITSMFAASSKVLKEAAQMDMDGESKKSRETLSEANEMFNQAVKKNYAFTRNQ